MKSIITPSVTFGPFNTVAIAADRYVTESGEYPLNVIGNPNSIGEWIQPAPPMPTQAEYTTAIQNLLDTTAQAHHYDSIISACSYAGAPNPFQTEGTKFVTWRGDCWAHCYSAMAAVNAATRPQPTVAELLAEMPAL